MAVKLGQLLNLLTRKFKKKINTIPIYYESSEAEAVKLFANTYLAMRISFFNELDSFCDLKKLNTNEVMYRATISE